MAKNEQIGAGPIPNTDLPDYSNKIGATTTAPLPKTGGFEALFMGALVLGLGFIVCRKAFSKKHK
ncbi:hypothetical protein AZF37_02930 [endosymbiont 'TC1' of Trimyema compressum]|uniref:hypothetical protein n=1 Tax=endosymbiont 'TC1' of Trimyema compressum TaxID=243899 RepID=UPI0007F06F77|nr:hypothetical protein [endosymbiont 'TC1' of Trimyema compressum]AMP20265.1 hypothetical protein AZF37_02930 [endosymbiont 'TC1' of Trimyema compressum]